MAAVRWWFTGHGISGISGFSLLKTAGALLSSIATVVLWRGDGDRGKPSCRSVRVDGRSVAGGRGARPSRHCHCVAFATICRESSNATHQSLAGGGGASSFCSSAIVFREIPALSTGANAVKVLIASRRHVFPSASTSRKPHPAHPADLHVSGACVHGKDELCLSRSIPTSRQVPILAHPPWTRGGPAPSPERRCPRHREKKKKNIAPTHRPASPHVGSRVAEPAEPHRPSEKPIR